MSVRPIGVLELEDEAGGDEKILAVPTRNITQLYDRVQSWKDIAEIDLRRIQHFFEHYKDLEANKWVKVKGWVNGDATAKEINDAVKRFEDAPEKPFY